MPMIWNADADAKLFAALLETHEVKVKPQLLAERMGSDCTAKAIIHRVAAIKAKAKKTDDDGSDTTPAKTAMPAKRGRKIKKAESDGEESPTKKTKANAAKPKAAPKSKATSKKAAAVKSESDEELSVKEEANDADVKEEEQEDEE